MKIAIKTLPHLNDDFEILAYCFDQIKMSVAIFSHQIFNILNENDILLYSKDDNDPELAQFLTSRKNKRICFEYNEKREGILDKILNIGSFGSTLKYSTKYYDERIATQLLYVNCAPKQDSTYKTKIAAYFHIPHQNFVGICSQDEIISLCYSSDIICSPSIAFNNSMILNNLMAVENLPVNFEEYFDKNTREQYVLSQKQKIKTETNLAPIIHEYIRNFS